MLSRFWYYVYPRMRRLSERARSSGGAGDFSTVGSSPPPLDFAFMPGMPFSVYPMAQFSQTFWSAQHNACKVGHSSIITVLYISDAEH